MTDHLAEPPLDAASMSDPQVPHEPQSAPTPTPGERSADEKAGWPAMSRRHVLAAAGLMDELSPTLFKTLMLLAVCADHRTGQSRPGAPRATAAGFGKSVWNVNCKELAAKGLIRIQRGVKGHTAPTYWLLYLPALVASGPENRSTSLKGKGISTTINLSLPLRGSGPQNRQYAPAPELTPAEEQVWQMVKAHLRPRLGERDWAAMTAGHEEFNQLTPLRRTIVRLAVRFGVAHVVRVLAHRDGPGPSPYSDASSVWKTMWYRTNNEARSAGIHMFNHAPAAADDDALLVTAGEPPQNVRDLLAAWIEQQAELTGNAGTFTGGASQTPAEPDSNPCGGGETEQPNAA